MLIRATSSSADYLNCISQFIVGLNFITKSVKHLKIKRVSPLQVPFIKRTKFKSRLSYQDRLVRSSLFFLLRISLQDFVISGVFTEIESNSVVVASGIRLLAAFCSCNDKTNYF